MDLVKIIGFGLVGCAVLFGLLVFAAEQEDCRARGGVMVRSTGLGWRLTGQVCVREVP